MALPTCESQSRQMLTAAAAVAAVPAVAVKAPPQVPGVCAVHASRQVCKASTSVLDGA